MQFTGFFLSAGIHLVFQGFESMVSMFVPCATQRLFFPDMLPDYRRILYVDTDFVFLNSPYNTWSQCYKTVTAGTAI
jgi:lipopolysaccharide biosynthesis glycosyltransferase